MTYKTRSPRPGEIQGVDYQFVRTDDYVAAREDGVVTIAELEALDPVMGVAHRFTETLHPEGANNY